MVCRRRLAAWACKSGSLAGVGFPGSRSRVSLALRSDLRAPGFPFGFLRCRVVDRSERTVWWGLVARRGEVASLGRAWLSSLRPAWICLLVAHPPGRAWFATRGSLGSSRASWVRHDRYLVDPASSHMLVSKIKPCMSKYNYLYWETANGSLNQL
jgi:hypothetical protein